MCTLKGYVQIFKYDNPKLIDYLSKPLYPGRLLLEAYKFGAMAVSQLDTIFTA